MYLKHRSLRQCDNAVARDRRIVCRAGWKLVDRGDGSIPLDWQEQGRPLEFEVCRTCPDFADNGRKPTAGELALAREPPPPIDEIVARLQQVESRYLGPPRDPDKPGYGFNAATLRSLEQALEPGVLYITSGGRLSRWWRRQ